MHKKLQKYIKSYDEVQNCTSYELKPNGGMIVLLNQEISCEIVIEESVFTLESFQAILLNASEKSLLIRSNTKIQLFAIRFKGAGASFFYEEYMDEMMYNPKEPIFIEKNIVVNKLDGYLLNRLKVGTLPFNIMKIIDLLDDQKSDYNIDELLALANVPRRILDKTFRLRVGMTFKIYASIQE